MECNNHCDYGYAVDSNGCPAQTCRCISDSPVQPSAIPPPPEPTTCLVQIMFGSWPKKNIVISHFDRSNSNGSINWLPLISTQKCTILRFLQTLICGWGEECLMAKEVSCRCAPLSGVAGIPGPQCSCPLAPKCFPKSRSKFGCMNMSSISTYIMCEIVSLFSYWNAIGYWDFRRNQQRIDDLNDKSCRFFPMLLHSYLRYHFHDYSKRPSIWCCCYTK